MENTDTMPPEAETEAAAEAPKPEKPKPEPLRKQNGVSEPRAMNKDGTVQATRQVWDICYDIGEAEGRAPTAGEVMEQGKAAGLNPATIQTQYNRFRRFYGIAPQGRIKKEKAADADAAADTDAGGEE